MARKEMAVQRSKAKVIPFKMDAAFFFERAVHSLDRCHYEKALKYFRRATEYEPENPVNHCNMAGILSEMGQFEESNSVLKGIIDSVDPTMTECYFYMANNFANMDNFEAAEKALVAYLEKDTAGEFVEESEEMMEMLSYELNRPVKLRTIKSREGLFEHDKARMMLEEGRFAEAVRVLERLIRKHPEFLAAKNNLALACYSLGRIVDAFRLIREVLGIDPGNLHALCNLAIFYRHAEDRAKLGEILGILDKTYPFHHEHVFKLATTMGILGNHRMAYRHFKRLLDTGDFYGDPCIQHYTAVAAMNIGLHQEARKLWKMAERFDPESDVPRYFLSREFMEGFGQAAAIGRELGYQYQLPGEADLTEKKASETADPLIRSAFLWALARGGRQSKLEAIQGLRSLGDEDMERALRAFLLDAAEDDYLKKVALFVMRGLGAKAPLYAVLDGKKTEADSRPPATGLPEWKDEWQRVMEHALEAMRNRYDIVQQHDLQTLWVEYLTRIYPRIPRLQKAGGWAAALEYWTAKMHRRKITYEEAAERYHVSAGTVSRHVKEIDEACGLTEKMRAIFSTYES